MLNELRVWQQGLLYLAGKAATPSVPEVSTPMFGHAATGGEGSTLAVTPEI